jgi:hypothetical protein
MFPVYLNNDDVGICWVIDPLYARQAQNIIPLYWNQVLHTVPDSFVAAAYVVVLFYLRDLAAAKLHRASRFAQGSFVAFGAGLAWALLIFIALLT